MIGNTKYKNVRSLWRFLEEAYDYLKKNYASNYKALNTLVAKTKLAAPN